MSWMSMERYWGVMSCASPRSPALLQELAGDDQLLDLAGALVDAEGAHLAVQALDGGAAHDALAAVDLHRPVHDALGGLGGEELGRRSLRADALRAAVLEPGRVAHEQAGGLEVDVHLGQGHLRGLELGEGAAELAARLRPARRFLQGARGQAARGRAHAGPEGVEGGQGETM